MEIGLLAQSGVSVAGIAVILIIYKILKVVNGKRIVSQCCGRKTEIGFQVENWTPIATVSTVSTEITMTENPLSPLPLPLKRPNDTV